MMDNEMMEGQGGLSSIGMEQESPMEEVQEGVQGITIEDVIKALMSGISPEELVQNGVPQELVVQAIQIIQEQAGQQQPMAEEAPVEGGLSTMGM